MIKRLCQNLLGEKKNAINRNGRSLQKNPAFITMVLQKN